MDWYVIARFWVQVDMPRGGRGARWARKSCWNWKGMKTAGYGAFSAGDGVQVLAHRFAWALANGAIPEDVGAGQHHGTVVLHTCDNRACVNPDHLRVGTQAENVRDMDRKGRRVNNQLAGEVHNLAKFTDADVVAIRLSGKSDPVLAKEYGVTSAAVRYARLTGWRHIEVEPLPYPNGKSAATTGANNANAKINDEIVRAIRASDAPPRELAEQYGIGSDYVTSIRKRRSWKHVE